MHNLLLSVSLTLGFPAYQGADAPKIPALFQPLAKSSKTPLQQIWGFPEQRLGTPHLVAFSSDCKTALVASYHGKDHQGGEDILTIWDLDSGLPVRTLPPIKTGSLTALAISPDGKFAIGGTYLGLNKNETTLLHWDLSTGKLVREWTGPKGENGIRNETTRLAFSGDGKQFLAACMAGPIQVWQVGGAKPLHTLASHGGSASFSPDGKKILIGNGGHNLALRIWDVATGKEELVWVPEGGVGFAKFLPDGKRVIGIGNASAPVLLEIGERKILRQYGPRSYYSSPAGVALSSDGTFLFTWHRRQTIHGDEHTVKAWDVDSENMRWEMYVDNQAFNPIQLSANNKTIMAGGGKTFFTELDAATGKVKRMFGGHRGSIRNIAVEPKTGRFWTACADRTVKRWAPGSSTEIQTVKLHDDAITGFAFADDKLLTLGADRMLKVWQPGNEKLIHKSPRNNVAFTCLAASKDGKFAATASVDGSVQWWDLTTGKCLQTFTGHLAGVTAVDISPDGTWVAAAGADKTVRVWYVGKEAKEVPPVVMEGHSAAVTAIRFLADGKHLLSASYDNTLRLWQVATGKEVKKHDIQNTWIGSLAVSGDDKRVVTRCGDSTIKVWNLETCKLLDSVDLGPVADVPTCVTMTSDGRGFLVGTLHGLTLRFALAENKR